MKKRCRTAVGATIALAWTLVSRVDVALKQRFGSARDGPKIENVREPIVADRVNDRVVVTHANPARPAAR